MSDYIEFTKEQEQSDEIGFYDDASSFNESLSACFDIGPLKVCATRVTAEAIHVEVKLAGVRIARGTISLDSPRICASANAGLAKVSLCVEADFAKQEVWVRGKLCVREILGGWSCRKFSTKILSW